MYQSVVQIAFHDVILSAYAQQPFFDGGNARLGKKNHLENPRKTPSYGI
jgi:hypothetical protein